MTPVARLKGDPLTRYELDANGCWIWQGASHSAGYGMLWSEDRKQVYAHRFFYEQHVGPIPDGLVIDHLCRVPACVNPAHLEPVTHLENCQRGVQPSSLRTHCVEGHPFDDENTYRPRRGGRVCKTCDLARGRRYRAAKAAARKAAAA
jgi:hypothetical protein